METKPEVTPEKIEEIMIETRIRLLKLTEVANLRVGKRIDTSGGNPYTVFYSFDTETMDKLKAITESAVYTQYEKQILSPNITRSTCYEYEMEPGKDVRYS
jgi:hypothetical protein